VSALASSRLAACQITIGRHDGSVKIVFKLNAHASRPDIIGELDASTSLTTRYDYAISHGLAMAARATPTQILARKTTGRDRMVQRSSL